MAAIVLLTIVVGGIVGAQLAATSLTRTARDTSIAVSDAQAAFEEILLWSIDDIPDEYPTGVSIASWDDAHLQMQRIVPTYPNMLNGDVPDPLQIRLTVTWNDYAGRPRSLTLDSVKVR